MATPISTLDNLVQITLTPRIDYFTRDLSPFFQNINLDSSSVTRDNWGQGWVVQKVFRTGLGGAVSFSQMDPGSAANVATDSGAPYNRFNIYGTNSGETWPSANNATAPASFKYSFGLTKMKGVMYCPAEIRRVDAMNASIGQQYAAIIDSTAEKVGLALCNSFHADVNTSLTNSFGGILGTVVVGTGTGKMTTGSWATSTAQSNISLTSGSVRRFAEGQEVDLYWINSTSLTKLNEDNQPVFVSTPEDLGDKISLVNITGSTISVPANTTTIYLVMHNGLAVSKAVPINLSTTAVTSNLPYSWNDIIKASGSIFGVAGSTTISLTRHPEFRSYVPASVGAALDESLLVQYAARMTHGRGTRYAPDLYVTTEGVFAGFTEGIDGMSVYLRNGQPLNVKAGVADVSSSARMSFEWNGKTYKIMTDPFVSAGTLYGVITRNKNWKRHVPPRLAGTGSSSVFDAGVEFLVPLLNPGAKDIWQGSKFTSSSVGDLAKIGATSSLLECPFELPLQIIPDTVVSMKLPGITEVYGPTI